MRRTVGAQVLGIMLALPVYAASPQGMMRDGQGAPQAAPNNQQQPDDASASSSVEGRGARQSERIGRMRMEREQRYERVRSRIGTLIAYLDGQGADTSAVKGYMETFSAKINGQLSAYDGYLAALQSYEAAETDATVAAVASTRDTLRSRIIDASDYYRATIMPALLSLIDSVAE